MLYYTYALYSLLEELTMLTYNQMKQFVTVVRNHSITKAAEELFIAQPAISATLKKFEQELAVDLFSYENKQMHLTNEGEKVYRIICEILELYQQLENFSATPKQKNKCIYFFAAPSVHQFITPQLQLFDIFPKIEFSFYDCRSFRDFYNNSQTQDNCFGIFHILDPYLSEVETTFSSYHIENIVTCPSSLLTSYKNSGPIAKRESITLNEIRQLPLVQVQGTIHSIHEYLKKENFNYILTVSNAQFIDTILYKKPNLYALGHNLYAIHNKHRLISIPITDVPKINLIYIYKCTSDYTELFSRIYALLCSLYAN